MTATLLDTLTPGAGEWSRRITASKIPGLFNASKYSSPTKEYHLLRGEIDPDGTNDAIERGNDFEGVILERWLRRNPEWERIPSGTFARPGLESWAAGTPDAMARHRKTGEVITLEAKTDGRGDYQWGPTGSSEVPLGFYLQKQWQLHMTGCPRGVIVCLGPFYEETEHPIDYDAALAADIEAFTHEFWRNAMDPDGKPPQVDGHEETYNAIRRSCPEIERDQDWPISFELAHEFEDAVHGLEAAEERLNTARSTLLRTMGRARRAVIGHGKNAQTVATRQPTKKGASAALYKFRKPIDWAAAELPPVES